MNKKIGSLSILLIMLMISGCSSSNLAFPEDTIDQKSELFGAGNIKNKILVVDFIFTNCETVCPPLTNNMSKLQEMAKEKELEVEFVSFSVDPENDTPEKLVSFAEQFEVDFTNWHFLTGYSQKEIEAFAQDSFKAIVQKPTSTDQVIHGTSFYLVNKKGEVSNKYSGLQETPYDQIIQDIENLQ
ncbi:SCO family protein [Bacillus sp. DJP31]|uniref:SCO family protein n=1 Tax=Bacillus sp. DJP31 TaxID=3409789 RepID=UPI003BB5ED9D